MDFNLESQHPKELLISAMKQPHLYPKDSSRNGTNQLVLSSSMVISIERPNINPFQEGPLEENKLSFQFHKDKNPFHLAFSSYSSQLKVVGNVVQGNIFRVRDEDSGAIYNFRLFQRDTSKQFWIELALIRYLAWCDAEFKKSSDPNNEIHKYFRRDFHDSFVKIHGLGNEMVSFKENWFFSLFNKTTIPQEKPLQWILYEPDLLSLKHLFDQMKKDKSKIPLYSAWKFFVKLSQILRSLKKHSLAHLEIKSETLFLQMDKSVDVRNSDSTSGIAFERIKHVKLCQFGSARLVQDGDHFLEYDAKDFSSRAKEDGRFLNLYQFDMRSVGLVMKDIVDFTKEKFYGHIIDQKNIKHVLKEKTKGLLKSLISRMLEPAQTQIQIEELWSLICNHTETLLKENPDTFEFNKKNRRLPSFLSESFRSPISQNQYEVPVAIFHAFNMKYSHIDEKLIQFIKGCGFSHIQISPTQKSHEYGAWHDKYQPEAYVVKNRYGNAADLEKLTKRAHSYGLKIIADIVFNHMGSTSWFRQMNRAKYEDKQYYFKYRKDLVKQYGSIFLPKDSKSDPNHYFTEWNEEGWHGGNLPQLNTMHPDVKRVQLNYLQQLRSLGVDGFRYDAIKTIDKQSLRDYVGAFGDKWSYGEFVSGDVHQNHEFTPIMPITDFVLLCHLMKVFCLGGTLRDLRVPNTNWDPRSVIFAVNHDTWASKNSWFGNVGISLTFNDDKDAELASLFILARHDGVPLILKTDAEKPSIQAGVKFRREMHNRNAHMEYFNDWIPIFDGCNLDEFLLMQRGEDGIFILNKSDHMIDVPKANVSAYYCPLGYYVNPENESLWRVYQEDNSKYLVNANGKFRISKRSGIFLIKIKDS